MTEHHAETVPSGIAVLAEDEPKWSDGPFRVRGVALPEEITPNSANTESLESGEQVRTYWPAETVQATAPLFDGAKIVNGIEHDPATVLEKPQPSPETIVGEITRTEYRPGTGVLYEGEIDDPEFAKLIQRDRVDVSPTLFRSLGDENGDGFRPVESVQKVRDLSIVAEGAGEGNSIEPAPAVAMSALAAEVLEATFGTDEGETTEAESSTDDADTDEAGSGDDGSDGDSSQSTAGHAEQPMTDDITDDQRELLAAADRLDDPMVVESEHADVLEAAAGCEEPHIVEQDEYEALSEDLDEAKGVFAEALAERSGMKAETLAALSWDHIREEFTDDEGDLDVETLVQVPETGETDADEETSEAAAELLESRGFDDRDEAVATLRERYEDFSNAGWTSNAEEVKADLETLGVEV